MHWDGAQWTTTTLGVGTFFAVWGSAAGDVWIGGQDLYHRDSGGWSQQPLGSGRIVFSIAGGGGRVFLGDQAGVLVYEGGVYTSIPAIEFTAMWAHDANDVWAVSPFGAVRRFTGTAWLEDGSTLVNTQSIGALSANYAVVADLAVPTTMQASDGAAWSTLSQCPTNSVRALWIAAKDDVFVVGGGSPTRYVADTLGGTPSWHAMPGAVGVLMGVWGRSGSDAFAVGNGGVILHWNGSAWTAMTSNTTQQLRAVWGTSTDVFAAGFDAVMHYDGVAWTAMSLPPGGHMLFSIWGTASNNVYAGGSGEILHWDGTSWQSAPANVDSTPISGTGPSDIFAVGTLGGMAHFDGVSWSPVRVPTTQNLSAIAVTPTRAFLAGTEGTQVLMVP